MYFIFPSSSTSYISRQTANQTFADQILTNSEDTNLLTISNPSCSEQTLIINKDANYFAAIQEGLNFLQNNSELENKDKNNELVKLINNYLKAGSSVEDKLTAASLFRNTFPKAAFAIYQHIADEEYIDTSNELHIQEAKYHTGLMLLQGIGVEKNPQFAFQYLTQANSPLAKYELGMYYYNEGDIIDWDKAFDYFQQVKVTEVIKSEAYYMLGVLNHAKKNFKEAIINFEEAYSLGYAGAKYAIALIYMSHRQFIQTEPLEKLIPLILLAIKNFKEIIDTPALQNFHARAHLQLGEIYLEICPFKLPQIEGSFLDAAKHFILALENEQLSEKDKNLAKKEMLRVKLHLSPSDIKQLENISPIKAQPIKTHSYNYCSIL